MQLSITSNMQFHYSRGHCVANPHISFGSVAVDFDFAETNSVEFEGQDRH